MIELRLQQLLRCWGSNRLIGRKLILNNPKLHQTNLHVLIEIPAFLSLQSVRPETLNNDSVARSLTDWVVELFIEWPILGRQNVICAECQHRWSGGNETITSLAVESKIRSTQWQPRRRRLSAGRHRVLVSGLALSRVAQMPDTEMYRYSVG